MLALYSDRHSIFSVNSKQRESLEEQLAGERQPTQVGRALGELGIKPIFAHSPQAKGRVERLWGTFQDRLVAELRPSAEGLRLAGASTTAEANGVLGDFLPRFNTRFAVSPLQPGSAYRPPEPGLCLEGVLCFKYQRTVVNDNTVKLGERTLQLLPGPERCSYAHARVELQERLDGSLVVTYQGRVIASSQAPPHPATLRARKGSRAKALTPPVGLSLGVRPDVGTSTTTLQRPGPDHPWRRPLW